MRGVSGRKLATGTRASPSILHTRAEVAGFAPAKAEMARWTCPSARAEATGARTSDRDERREKRPSPTTAYAVVWSSSSAWSGSRWPAAATDLTNSVLSMRPL